MPISFSKLVAILAFLGAGAVAEIPEFKFQGTKIFPPKLAADIAASQFVDQDGVYHFISSVASYNPTDDGSSFTRTFTGDNFAHLTDKWGTSETSLIEYNSYWNKPGSFCYQLDKRPVNPMPTLYQDDHCDVIGVWIDPATKTWWGAINDEYQFDPWNLRPKTANTTSDRIHTGLHNNRLLLSKSNDKGKTWEIVHQIVTDEFQPQQTITPELFPNKTYSWGLSGVRWYPDHVSGYIYLLYNHQFRNKFGGDQTLLQYFALTRASMASDLSKQESWKKWYGGKWEEPGIGGRDGYVGEPLGFNVKYDPKTDYLAFEGKGADGKDIVYKSEPFDLAAGFKFKDLTQEYLVGTAKEPHNITNAAGQVVSKVEWVDPSTGRKVSASIGPSRVAVFNATDSDGASYGWVPSKGRNVFKSAAGLVYVPPKPLQEAGFSYHVPSGQYIANGYELPVSATKDLGDPLSWRPIGKQTADMLGHAAYMSVLDTGSMTNQFITGRTLSLISDLRYSEDRYTAPASTYSPDFYNRDAAGAPLTEASYAITIGGKDIGTYALEWVRDTYSGGHTGFFRLKGAKGYLRTLGSVADQRKWGAAVVGGDKLPDFDPAGNNGRGAPYGSDNWFILPYTSGTSLTTVAGHKLVQRVSHNVVGNGANGPELRPNERKTDQDTAVVFKLAANRL